MQFWNIKIVFGLTQWPITTEQNRAEMYPSGSSVYFRSHYIYPDGMTDQENLMTLKKIIIRYLIFQLYKKKRSRFYSRNSYLTNK